MIGIDPRHDYFVSPPRAAAEAGVTAAKFRRLMRAGPQAPVYRLPAVAENAGTIDRFLRSDLRSLASGALR